jgi:hypothetical protein
MVDGWKALIFRIVLLALREMFNKQPSIFNAHWNLNSSIDPEASGLNIDS